VNEGKGGGFGTRTGTSAPLSVKISTFLPNHPTLDVFTRNSGRFCTPRFAPFAHLYHPAAPAPFVFSSTLLNDYVKKITPFLVGMYSQRQPLLPS
jgi:hypothetical protein